MNITQKFLTPNKYSRPQKKLEVIKKIAVHWVGNAGSAAIGNWNYFESLKEGKKQIIKGSEVFIFASSNFIIGLDGEILQNMPENEIAYCTNSANSYSLSIECCHPDWNGKFTDKTYNSLIELCVYLCKKYKLNPLTDIIRHYDITYKCCPKWFVDHIDEWNIFKNKVANLIKENNEQAEFQKALQILSTKKVKGLNDVIINSPKLWEDAIKNKNINYDLFELLLIKTSKYLEQV